MAQPKCRFFISPEERECGKPAPHKVKTRITRKDSATVDLCTEHKHKYDEQYARMRTESKVAR